MNRIVTMSGLPLLQVPTSAPTPPVPPTPPTPPLLPPDFQTPMPPMPDFLFWNEIIIPLAGMALTGILIVVVGLPLVKALVRRIESKGAAAGDAEVAALRAEVAELRQRLDGMAELEERVDFAERLLTQQRERPPLRAGE